MDTFDAPREATDEIDYAAAKPGILVVVAGAAQIFAGATTLAQGVQLWALFVFYNWMWVLPYFLVPMGLIQMALGATASRGRDWAAILGLVVTWGLQLVALLFTAWSLMQGGIIVMAFAWTFIGLLASLLAPMAVPGALKASSIRRKLYT
ncbi:MAG: hypothetical protein H6737_19100 [Alphaproteobacteria bacterium]|nr:hypothetical protein [Alphaproteobacteria bacterium]